MSTRSSVWSLLLAQQGNWVSRDDIESVGGYEGMRRLREIRAGALSQGYELRSRKGKDGTLEYSLILLTASESAVDVRWACVKCGASPAGTLQPTTDTRDRFRFGWCPICPDKHAIFARKERA